MSPPTLREETERLAAEVAGFRAAIKRAALADLRSVLRWLRGWWPILGSFAFALVAGALFWRFGPFPLRHDLDALEARVSILEAKP